MFDDMSVSTESLVSFFPAFSSAKNSSQTSVQIAYIAYYGRPADPSGLNYWSQTLDNAGGDMGQIITSFGQSAEFTAQYGSLSPTDLVNNLYVQLFNRNADSAGLDYYVSVLKSGASNLAAIALEIAKGATGKDLNVLSNKLLAADYFTSAIKTENKQYSTESINPIKSILANVSDKSASLDAAYGLWDDLITNLPAEAHAQAKGEGRIDLSFSGDQTKATISGDVHIEPVEFSVQTIESNDIIGLDDFARDPRFQGLDGEGYSIVILDTGIDLDHPFFGPDRNNDGVSDRIVYHADFTDDYDRTVDDVHGHGTNVASIAASSDRTYQGVAPGANIIALQVLGNSGSGNSSAVERALQWVVYNAEAYNIVAVNMSLGMGGNYNQYSPDSTSLSDEFQALVDLNVLPVVAAGNDYYDYQEQGVAYPSSDRNTISVGATFDDDLGAGRWSSGSEVFESAADRITPFSQRSTTVMDIFAPGAWIEGAAPGGGVLGMTGTSQAAPYVAGTVVIMQQLAERELGRRLTIDEFTELMRETGVRIFDGDDEDDNVNHDFASYERLDLMALANAIYAMKGEPEAPNNSQDDIPANISTSASIAVGEQIFGTLDHAGDKDWYQVYLSSNQRYRFSLEGAADNRVSGVSDPWLALHNDAGTFLVSDDDGGTGLNAQIEFTVAESGQYFLSAEAYGEETGGYRLSVTGIQNELLRDRYPDNNTTAVGVLINDGYGRNPWEAINTPGDHDWWRQILNTGYKYTINVKGASSNSGDLLDPAFRILDKNGNELKRDNDSGQGADASLVFVPDEYGVYYFDVYSFNEADTGLYEVEIFVEEIENSEVPGNATTNIDLNPLFFSMKNTIDFAGDTDWYRLEMDANTAYLLTVWSRGDEDKGETPLHDPVLTIYDEHGTVLMSMDDGILNFPVLLINPDHDGTFYAEVSGFSTAETGDYLFWGGIHVDDDYFDMAFPGSAVLNFGISRNGTINTVDDLDWLEVQLIAGEQYEFEVRGQSSGGGTLIDPVLHIYNGLGHPLNIHDHDLGNGLDEKISYIPKSSGTYFLVVSSEETGTYTISAESPDSIPVDDFAGGMLTEGRLNAGQQVQGSIETQFDEDWFLVSLDVGSYRIDVENAGGASGLADPAFELFDFLGVTYDISDDNSGVGLNAAKNINVSSPVSVFIGVTGSHASTGDYILSLTEI